MRLASNNLSRSIPFECVTILAAIHPARWNFQQVKRTKLATFEEQNLSKSVQKLQIWRKVVKMRWSDYGSMQNFISDSMKNIFWPFSCIPAQRSMRKWQKSVQIKKKDFPKIAKKQKIFKKIQNYSKKMNFSSFYMSKNNK